VVGIGFSLAILLFGLADAIKWSYPFQSYVVNFTYNVIQDKANPKPWYSLIENLFLRTGPLPLLAIWGGRRSPFLACVALAILLPHSLIHHKEYRFIYPMLPILVLLAVLGLLDLFAKLNGKLKTPLSTSAVAAAAVAFFCLISVGIGGQFPFWRERTGILRAFNSLSHDDHLCGLAMEQHNWAYSGGYSHLHRQVPIFLILDIASHQPQPEIYNEIIVEKPLADIPGGFQLSQCWPGACLYHRTGSCASGGQELEINAALKRIGQ
jgi:GPI mannosyltransferase 3